MTPVLVGCPVCGSNTLSEVNALLVNVVVVTWVMKRGTPTPAAYGRRHELPNSATPTDDFVCDSCGWQGGAKELVTDVPA